MDLLQALYLALIQGLTEFLPVSSSAHLILLPSLLGDEDQGLAFDVAVHVGTLVAVVWYFRRDLKTIIRDWLLSLQQRQRVGESTLGWAVLLGTIPVGLAGLLFKGYIETELRSVVVIAWASILFGILLLIADRRPGERSEHSLGWKDVLVIGVAQALALIPGTSRSGVTMTAGLLMGLSRTASARFSFLLSIPVIVLAGGLNAVELVQARIAPDWGLIAVGVAVSALSAYLCIRLFLSLLERTGMLPFVLYRVALGTLLLVYFA